MGRVVAFMDHLGTFLAVLSAFLGRLFGPTAPSEHYLHASFSEPLLPKTSKTIPKTIPGQKNIQMRLKNHAVFAIFHDLCVCWGPRSLDF